MAATPTTFKKAGELAAATDIADADELVLKQGASSLRLAWSLIKSKLQTANDARYVGRGAAIEVTDGDGITIKHAGTPSEAFAQRVKFHDTDQTYYAVIENNAGAIRLSARNESDDALLSRFFEYDTANGTADFECPVAFTQPVTVPDATEDGQALNRQTGDVRYRALGAPIIDFAEADQAADAGKWRQQVYLGNLYVQPTTDSGAPQNTPLIILRDGRVTFAGATELIVPDPSAGNQALNRQSGDARFARSTGRRDVSGEWNHPNFIYSRLEVIRNGPTVQIDGLIRFTAASSSAPVLAGVPSGFGEAAPFKVLAFAEDDLTSPATSPLSFLGGANTAYFGSASKAALGGEGVDVAFQAIYTTDDPWPTTLPGVAL